MGYPNVRVVNAGVGGCGTFCQLGQLENNIAWMQPDLVVDAVFVGNNISENVLWTAAGYQAAPWHPKGITWGASAAALVDQSGHWFARNGTAATNLPPPWDPSQPLPAPVGNSPIPAPPPPATFSKRALWDGLRAHSLLLSRLFGSPVDPSVTTAPGELPLAQQQEQLNLTSFEWTILQDPPRTYWLDVAWPLFGEYLAQIDDTAASVNAPTVVMVIPQMGQFDAQARYRSMYDYRFAESEVDWNRPQAQVAAEVDRLGLPELDLLPIFRERPDADQLYLREDTHFSALGHQVVAGALATYLRNANWLPGAAPRARPEPSQPFRATREPERQSCFHRTVARLAYRRATDRARGGSPRARGAQSTHALDFEQIRRACRENGYRAPASSTRVRQSLAEIASRRAHELVRRRAIVGQRLEEVIRAPALERADRVHALELAQDAWADLVTECVTDKLWGVEEDRIDVPRRFGDVLQRQRTGVMHTAFLRT